MSMVESDQSEDAEGANVDGVDGPMTMVVLTSELGGKVAAVMAPSGNSGDNLEGKDSDDGKPGMQKVRSDAGRRVANLKTTEDINVQMPMPRSGEKRIEAATWQRG